jgi:transposase InsO family protein
MITMDFITDLPISHEYDLILVVVDHGLMKGIVLIPCTRTFGALETADALLRNVYWRFGLPDVIISDQGPQFVSHMFRKMGKLLGIELRMSMAYHPQTDEQTEHLNQELEMYL